MGNWERMTDYEAEKIEEFHGRFTINFKKIYFDIDEINERTLEVNDRHPKDSLMKAWAGCLAGLFIAFLLGYKVFALVIVPFVIFYLMALVKAGKCWKGFGYKVATYWIMSIFGVAASLGLAVAVRTLFIRFVLN